MSTKNKLSTKQRAAIDAMLSGANQSGAASAAGVTERTLHRWLTDNPAFGDELQRRSKLALHGAALRLAGALDQAVSVMSEIMHAPGPDANVRLRAANYMVTHAIRLLELSDFERRLSALEEQLTHEH